MSTVFPKKRLRASEIIDADEVNSNVRELLGEAESNLGEHNQKRNAFDIADLDTEAVFRVASVSNSSQIKAGDNTLSYIIDGYEDGSQFQIADAAYAWLTIEPMSGTLTSSTHSATEANDTFSAARLQFQTGNSVIWMLFSGQLAEWTAQAGLEVGLAFDGQVIPETILGLTDRTNDTASSGFGWGYPHAVACEGVIPCSSGHHTFEVKVRSAPDSDLGVSLATWVGVPAHAVGSFDFIVIEMK